MRIYGQFTVLKEQSCILVRFESTALAVEDDRRQQEQQKQQQQHEKRYEISTISS